jgi:hypothetical protein
MHKRAFEKIKSGSSSAGVAASLHYAPLPQKVAERADLQLQIEVISNRRLSHRARQVLDSQNPLTLRLSGLIRARWSSLLRLRVKPQVSQGELGSLLRNLRESTARPSVSLTQGEGRGRRVENGSTH